MLLGGKCLWGRTVKGDGCHSNNITARHDSSSNISTEILGTKIEAVEWVFSIDTMVF